MRLVPLLLLAAACTVSPPPPETAPAIIAGITPEAPPTRPAPRSFVELDAAGRREVCTAIVEQVRLGCDPELRHFDATLIDQCTGDHPIWTCAGVLIDDHTRCIEDREAAACTAHQKQAEACGVSEALRKCPLVVDDIDPGGPAELAGLKEHDVILTVAGAPRFVHDLEDIQALVQRGGAAPLRITAVTPGHPVRDLTLTPTGTPPQLGATLVASPTCRGFTPRFAAVPCKARTGKQPEK